MAEDEMQRFSNQYSVPIHSHASENKEETCFVCEQKGESSTLKQSWLPSSMLSSDTLVYNEGRTSQYGFVD